MSLVQSLITLIRRIKTRAHTLLYSQSFLSMGKKVAIESPCRIMGANHISIKRDSFIGSDSWIAALPHLLNAESSKNTELIAIGENVCISGHCTITAVNSVKIEDHVLIARYVYISDHSHEYGDPVVPIKNQGIKNIKAVHIKKGAWIGQGAVICPGVTIGANSVVGANSIVRIDVPDHAVAAGNPASIIKKGKSEQ